VAFLTKKERSRCPKAANPASSKIKKKSRIENGFLICGGRKGGNEADKEAWADLFMNPTTRRKT